MNRVSEPCIPSHTHGVHNALGFHLPGTKVSLCRAKCVFLGRGYLFRSQIRGQFSDIFLGHSLRQTQPWQSVLPLGLTNMSTCGRPTKWRHKLVVGIYWIPLGEDSKVLQSANVVWIMMIFILFRLLLSFYREEMSPLVAIQRRIYLVRGLPPSYLVEDDDVFRLESSPRRAW